MERRDFLFLGGTLMAALSPLGALAGARPAAGVAASSEAVRVGRWILQHLGPTDRAAAVALSRRATQAQLTDFSRLAVLHEDDLANDRMVDVDGWFLSRSEALNWAAYSIQTSQRGSA